MKKQNVLWSVVFLLVLFSLSSCGDDDAPAPENEEEVITDVTLTFTPTEGDPIVVTAIDEDGVGSGDFVLEGINLFANTTYTLTIKVENSIEGEDITEEIEEEADEHMFFFEFTEGLFSNPTGDGNFDNRADALNYNDEDDNGLPIGLSTSWTTIDDAKTGTFRIVLKHQPDTKSETSDSSDGASDIDLEWDINISEPVLIKVK